MKSLQQQSAGKRKGKMLLLFPLICFPFIGLAFWALGGGKGTSSKQTTGTPNKGLNLQLPAAHLKDDPTANKMSFYEMLAQDSAKFKEQQRAEPYLSLRFNPSDSAGSTESKLYQKLDEINTAVAAAGSPASDVQPYHPSFSPAPAEPAGIAHIKTMMETLGKKDTTTDPEMDQINGMLDKIMAIQHPEQLNIQTNSPGHPQQPRFAVTRSPTSSPGFFSTGHIADTISELLDAIPASFPEAQNFTSGATLKLRLLQPVTINQIQVPVNTALFGRATLNGERLMVAINSIRYGEKLLPVDLSVYDLDGMEGIYIPGTLTRDVARQSSDNALQSFNLGTFDPSIGAQAASAGIQTAKTLISRKVKLVRVNIKLGYRVLLKDNHH